MGPNSTEEARAFIHKVCNFTRKFCHRSASDHPFIVGMLCFSLFLYKFLPSLFFFLVSSSPVLVCTFVLLGTLLSFGDAYIPQVEEEEEEVGKIHDAVSSLRSRGVGSDVILEKDESFGLESYVEKSEEGKDLIFEEKTDEGDGQGEEEEKPLIEVGESDRGIEGVDFGFVQYSAISKRIDEEEEEESSEYDTDSDRAESSSPDASMAEIMPMLDELHPLLDSEPSQPVVASDLDVDVASESHRSSDGSEDDEVENAESEDARERQGGGTEAVVVTWTKEDEKNLMLLGNSELERNRRLESLIARRRARKNFRVMMAEKNLIDLDVGEPGFQIAPISTARRNPFDLHYDSNEGMELPPIPGSAPSVLAPRRNPFDIPYDPFEERPNLAGGSFEEEFFSSHDKDNIFRRHESFSAGSSIFGEPRPLKSASKLKPFFVPERLHPEVGYSPTFQRQLSEISESKVSVTETESVSSASDQDSHKNKTEEESFETVVARGEQELSQLMDHFEYSPVHAKLESSSLEVNLVETNTTDHRNVVADADEREFNPLDMESVASPMGSDITVGSIITDVYVKCEAVEEKHIELGQTSSHVNTNTGVEAREPETDNTYANNLAQLPVEDEQPMLHVGQQVSQSMGRAHDHSETESSSSEEIDLVEFDHRDAEGNAHERQSISLEMKSVASPMESDTTTFSLKPEVEGKNIELHSSSSSELIDVIHHVNTSEALGDPEPKNDDNIGISSMQPAVEDSSWMEGEGTQMKEPVYDWNWYPSGVEKTLSGISIVEEALAYGDTKAHISTSLLELDMPVEYPEVQATSLQVERTVSFVDDDNVLHHENIEEETTSGNDGLCNSSSDLPVAGENQLVEDTMTSGHDVAQVGLPGDDQNDEYLQTPVLPSVTEQVLYDLSSSSSSSSSSSEGEFEDENSVTTEADVVDAAGPDNSGLLSEDPTHTMMETPPPLLEEAMLHQSSDSYREESQEISRSVVVSTIESDANDEVVSGDVPKDVPSHSFPTSVPCKISNNEPATREIKFEDTLHDEIQHSRYSDDLEHSSFSQVQTDVEETDKEFNEIEEITEIEEGLLMELDAVGDFGTVELETNTNQMENQLVVNAQESLTGLQVLETDSSKDVGDKSNETVDSVEMVPDLQSSELSVEGEVHLTSKEILVDEMEGDGLTGVQVLEPNSSKDTEDQSQKIVDSMEIPPYSQSFESIVGEVHSTLEQVSVDKVEGRSLSGLQALAPDSSNEIEDISQKTMDSMQVEPDLQNFEPRVQQVDLTSENLSSDEMEDESLAGLQVYEPNSSKDVGDESHETVDSIEVLPELQSFDPIVQGDVLLTSEQLSMDEIEDKSLARLQVHEPETSKDAKDESHETFDSTEVLPDLESFEPRVEGEVHFTTEQLSVEEMEDMSHPGSQVHESDSSKDVEYESHQTIDSFEVSSDVQTSEPKAGEEHLATEERSVDKMEDKSVTGLQDVLKPDSSKDVVDEFHQTIDSVEVLPDLPSFETRVEGEVHVASKEPSTDKMEDESLICPQVPKPDSSKDVEDESHQIIDSMEVVQDSQSSEPIAGDVHATSKEVPVEDELKPSEDSEMVMNSSIKANRDFEYALSEESKTSVDESKSVVEESKTSVDEKSGVEERQKATSSTIDVKKKKKGSTVSKSGSSSSSSSSDSD